MIDIAYPVDDLDFVRLQTPEFWVRFRGARMLITGGTGFIGSWLLQVIQRANDCLGCNIEVVVISRSSELAMKRFPHIFSREDVTLVDGNLITALPIIGSLDLCIHAAADVGNPLKTGTSLQMFDALVDGTRRVLDCAIAGGAKKFCTCPVAPYMAPNLRT